jgi:hypothetical protein
VALLPYTRIFWYCKVDELNKRAVDFQKRIFVNHIYGVIKVMYVLLHLLQPRKCFANSMLLKADENIF